MSMLTILQAALSPLADGRVFPDIAPENTLRPYITWQEVGGQPINFLDQALPGKANARIQINVWADTRLDASFLTAQVETVMRQTTVLQTTVLGNAISRYEPDTKLKGYMQDFSIWN
jgi:hypothetical protein